MSIELRTIRCHHFRVTREPCPNPAVVEIMRPAPHLLCAEHAALELQAPPGHSHTEGWEHYGAEEYARYCEQAMNALEEWSRTDSGRAIYRDNPVLCEVLEEAITYLRLYELARARRELEARGGRREETDRERDERELIERWLGDDETDGEARPAG